MSTDGVYLFGTLSGLSLGWLEPCSATALATAALASGAGAAGYAWRANGPFRLGAGLFAASLLIHGAALLVEALTPVHPVARSAATGLAAAFAWAAVVAAAYALSRARTVRGARDRAVDEFRNREAGLHGLFEGCPIGIYRATPDGHLLLANPVAVRLFGATSFEHFARAPEHGNAPAPFTGAEPQHRTGADDEVRGREVEWRGADGHVRIVRDSARAVRGPCGAVLYYEGTLEDVTERRRAEEVFRVLFEQSSDAHLIFDEERGIIDCNAAAVQMLRCRDKREVLTLHPAELSPEFQPDGRRSLEKCVEMDATARRLGFHRFDWAHQRMDGEVFPCEVTITPVELQSRSALLVVWHDLTERKRTEDALRASEERFRAFTDNMPLAAWVIDPDGRVSMANAQLGRLLGAPEGLVGRHRRTLNPAELVAEHEANDRRVLDTGRPVETEERFVRTDGRTGTALVVKFPVRRPDGAAAVGGVALDVTDRKRAEDALRYQAALLRSLIESGPDGVLVVDPAARILSSNRQFLRVWGFSDELLAGGSERTALAEAVTRVADPDGFLTRVQALSADPNAVAVDEVALADGRVLERHTAPVLGADGQRYGRVWHFRDVTGRKAAEDALRASEERNRKLALVASRTQHAVIIADAAGRIEWVNDGFTRITGYTLAEVAGLRPGEFLHGPGTDPAVVRDMGARIRRREGFTAEIQSYTKAGEPYWAAIDARPVFDAAGALTHFISVEQDVTAARRAADELRRAKEAAEAASRAKGEFLANVSHELRTPLNGIIGMTDLALSADLPPAQRERLGLVRESAGTLLDLVNDLLDLAKVEAGKFDLESVRFDPHETVAGAVRAQAARARQKGLDLTYEVAPNVPRRVVGDPGRLCQVLTNLIGNAIKFTDRGRIRVSARACGGDGDGVALTFEVTDTGIGIPADKLEAIFRPFEQADGSTTRKYGGTGLGLSIVDRFTRMMGGRIVVESAPGRGSTFTATARFGTAAPGDSVAPRDPAASPLSAAPARRLRLLMAEDNPVNRRVAEELLTRAGHSLIAVGDGAAAVAAWAEGGFDAVLMDVQMPVMGGLEATAAIRDRERASGGHTPIVALTARAMAGDEATCLAAGMDAYLTKPLDPVRLLAVLAELTGAPPRPAPVPAPDLYDLEQLPPDIRDELVGMFLQELPTMLSEVREAVTGADARGIEQAAHRLAGATANFGASAAVAAARRLEIAGRSGNVSGSGDVLDALEREFSQLSAALLATSTTDQSGWATQT